MRNLALVERAKQALASSPFFFPSHFDMQIEDVAVGLVRKTINASRATQNKPNNSNPWVTGKGQILLIPSHHKKPEKPKPKPKQMHNVCCQIRPLCWNQTTIKRGKRKRERKGSPIPAPRKTAENEAHFMGIAKRWVMFYGSKTPKTKQRIPSLNLSWLTRTIACRYL